VAKFSLIDLAGSERISDQEKNPDRIEEAKFINKSLSALGNVVAALRGNANKKQLKMNNSSAVDRSSDSMASKRRHTVSAGINPKLNVLGALEKCKPLREEIKGKEPVLHVPYRDSKLTHILKDSLGSNSFTHLIITLSPSILCL